MRRKLKNQFNQFKKSPLPVLRNQKKLMKINGKRYRL